MEQLSAAENHIVQLSSTRWRLLYEERPLAEAVPDGFRFGARFGVSRRLNTGGILQPNQLDQVVLGWQHTDEAWHLGLTINPELAQERGSRWVELVYWPDPDVTVFQDLAERAGKSLATALGIPFYMIPPQPAPKEESTIDLPELPQKVGFWTMERVSQDKRRFIIQRDKDWLWQQYSQIAWNLLWIVIYLGVSVGTLLSDIALPNTGTLLPDPRVLPYLGLLAALMFAGNILYTIWKIGRKPDRIFIDGVAQTISAWKGQTMHWQVSVADIRSVYVSEVFRKKEDPHRTTEYGELNLHLGGGEFHFLLKYEEPEENAVLHTSSSLSNAIAEQSIEQLTPTSIYTKLQIMGLYTAIALGDMPAWADIRTK